MFVITTVRRDPKTGELYVSVGKKSFAEKDEAQKEMRKLYEAELREYGLEDNGVATPDGDACPGGYCVDNEAAVYDHCDYCMNQLLEVAVFTVAEIKEG